MFLSYIFNQTFSYSKVEDENKKREGKMKSAINKCDKQLCPREIPGELGPILLHPKKGNNIHSHIMFATRKRSILKFI